MSLDFSKQQIDDFFNLKGEEIKTNFKNTVEEELDT